MSNYGRKRHPRHVETLCSCASKVTLTMRYFIGLLKVCVKLKSNFILLATNIAFFDYNRYLYNSRTH